MYDYHNVLKFIPLASKSETYHTFGEALMHKPCIRSGAKNKSYMYSESRHLQICDMMACLLSCRNRNLPSRQQAEVVHSK